jgi:tripartite-type tricarboxylate transporter receptor subunit TctC
VGAASIGRRVTAALAAVLALAAPQSHGAAPAKESNYPTRPIRLIALSSAGSGPDIVGRMLGARLTEAWGQQVIVDTRPGASGIIGSEIAAKAPPDGHTLVIFTSQVAIVSSMYDKLPYDIIKDFAPVGMLGTTPFLLVVNPTVQATSIKELIALLRTKGGDMRYGSGGSGSPPHLSAEIFKSMTGATIQHVPYKGITPAMTDAIAGQVHMIISVIPAVLPTVKSGRLRALGVTSAKRSAIVPDIPAISETVSGYEFIGWYSIFAPARTPAAIIDKLNVELVRFTKDQATRDRLADLGVEALSSTPQELARYLPAQMEKMAAAVKASGAKPDR